MQWARVSHRHVETCFAICAGQRWHLRSRAYRDPAVPSDLAEAVMDGEAQLGVQALLVLTALTGAGVDLAYGWESGRERGGVHGAVISPRYRIVALPRKAIHFSQCPPPDREHFRALLVAVRPFGE